jgi:type II secretory pathway component PulL
MPSRATSAPPDDALARQWETALGLPVRLDASPAEHLPSVLTASKSANLLTGEFAPRDALGKWTGWLTPALRLLVLMVTVHVAFTLIDNGRLNGERLALEREMTQLFKAAFPAAQAIIDPPLQMQRNLQQLKRERGLPAEADAQMLIARLAALMQSLPGAPASVTTLTFRDGVATLEAILATAEQRAHLQRAVERVPGAALGKIADPTPAPLAVRVTLRAGA